MMEKKESIRLLMGMFKEYGDILAVDDLQKMLSVSRASVYTLLKIKK